MTASTAAAPAAEQVPVWRGRRVLYALGTAAVLYGVWGLFATAEKTRPVFAALWFGGGVAAHDGLLVPVVVLVGAAVVRWVPLVARPVVQGALFVSGAVSLVALPLVGGFGGAAGNPSANPLPYGRNLALVLAVVWAGAAVLVLLRVRRRRREEAAARPA